MAAGLTSARHGERATWLCSSSTAQHPHLPHAVFRVPNKLAKTLPYQASVQPSCSDPSKWQKTTSHTHMYTNNPVTGPGRTKGAQQQGLPGRRWPAGPSGTAPAPPVVLHTGSAREWREEFTVVVMEISHSSFYHRVTIRSYEKLKLI